MVQSYLRHGPTEAFGLICSASSNSYFDGKNAYVPALEDVLVWDVKKGNMQTMWHDTGYRAEVTCIQPSPQSQVFAVGYADGSIRLWNLSSGVVITTFNGHKKAVTALAFDQQGTRLASGSQDTDLIIWDVVVEIGLFRLRGHRDQITGLCFLSAAENQPSSSTSTQNMLLTSSKDTFLKLWDLVTQHCIQTVVAHRAEIWTLDYHEQRNLIFTGSNEGELKAWKLDRQALADGLKETVTGEVARIIHPFSTLPLSSSHRVSQIGFHPSLPYLAVQSHDRNVEIFRIRDEEEVRKKQARRKKRVKEKQEKGSKKSDQKAFKAEPQPLDMDGNDEPVTLVDLLTPHLVIRANGKVRSFAYGSIDVKGNLQIMLALSTNALEIWGIPPPTKTKESPPEANRVYSVDIPGHRSDVRSLCLSSDDRILASAANGSLKLWNMKTTACIRTMECGPVVCSTFLPGDRHLAVGTKSGEIMIYDLASSSLIQVTQAHTGTVWSIQVRPDKQQLVSGSADKDIKFWEFEWTDATPDSVRSGKVLSLVHVRTLKMQDDVLAIRYSPNGKLLAVALLDSTVKVFYQDTLKFFLSLYGHKLPVLSMDISYDSKLIVTCSADKNVKIWGLDFGDCHKSIFAHDDSVMQVAFEHESHYFWTVGKDKLLKYWDGDKFENIQKLEGHHSEVWALALSHFGKFVVTGSRDKSIRVWEKLDEPLFPEEERERELEATHEAGIADSLNREDIIAMGERMLRTSQTEVTTVAKQTTETLMAGERIVDAITLADEERAKFEEYNLSISRMSENDRIKLQPPPRNQILIAYNLEPGQYVLHVMQKIPSAALHDALLTLPFTKVVSLMVYLDTWAEGEWNIPLTSRIIFFLLKTYHHQIVAHRVMRASLIPLRKHLRDALSMQKEIAAYNLAALRYVRRRHDSEHIAQFYEEGLGEEQIQERIAEGKKRKRVNLKS